MILCLASFALQGVCEKRLWFADGKDAGRGMSLETSASTPAIGFETAVLGAVSVNLTFQSIRRALFRYPWLNVCAISALLSLRPASSAVS